MIKKIVITISEDYLDKIKSITESLIKEGLVVTNVYEFGVIIGNAEDINIIKLKNRREIISVTEEKHPSIDPPEEDIQ